jgi:Putative auto-transporter adhesin, head GIN domain
MTFTPSPFLLRVAALLVAASAGAALSTPARADDGKPGLSIFGIGNRITGSGKLASESRAVSGFQAVALRGSMQLVLRQGAREGIELRADDNLLPLIETVVVDRGGVPTLEIGTKKGSGFSTKNPIVATIDLITLRALSISGSGDVRGDALKTPGLAVVVSGSGNIRLKQIAADELSAKVSGSGDLEFSGRAAKLAISISGSGDVQTRGLEADDVSVNVAGSGDADVTARKTLAVSIAGVGSVKYTGDATVTSSIAGHGKVTKQ